MMRTGLCAVVLSGLLLTGGCASQRLQQERDALYVQNQELQEELTRARQARDRAEQGRQSLESELSRARQTQPVQPLAPVVIRETAGANKFAGIAGVETFERDGEIAVRVPGDVLFAAGQVELRAAAKTTLTQIATVLKREYPGRTIRVEGYTDTDPIRRSTWKDNLELSLQRAAAVHRHLVEQGISGDNMYAAGFGPSKPQGTKEKSRRVEIVVTH